MNALQFFLAIGLMLPLLHEGCCLHLLVWLACKPVLQSSQHILPTRLCNEGRWLFTRRFHKCHEASQGMSSCYPLHQKLVSHSRLVTEAFACGYKQPHCPAFHLSGMTRLL